MEPQNNTPIDQVNPYLEFVKLSDMIANPLIKVYKAGELGLVFIFVGLLLIIFAQIRHESKYSLETFIMGIVLISCSFILFLYLQIKNLLTKASNIDKGKEVIRVVATG